MYTSKLHRIIIIFLCNLIKHSFCAYRPKIAPIFCAFCQGLSAVALAQVNFAKISKIKEGTKSSIVTTSQPKWDPATRRHVVALAATTMSEAVQRLQEVSCSYYVGPSGKIWKICR